MTTKQKGYAAVQEPILQPKGLYTFPNVFSEAPPGALEIASNVVIDRESVVTTRRGFKDYANLGASTTQADAFTSYQDKTIAHVFTTGAHGKLLLDNGAGSLTFNAYTGDFDQPDPTDPASRVRFVQANKNLYFLTSQGVKKLDSTAGTPMAAGAPQGFGGTGAATGATGFLANNTNTAYRIVWGYKDANLNLVLGAPGDRIVVSNVSGTAANVNVTFQIPLGVDTTWFYQIYRSAQTVNTATIPDDEMQQVYEKNPTSGEISARTITVLDNVPDDLRQATIYTAPSQEGIENSNYLPPFATDFCTYRDQVFYANTRHPHTMDFTLISAGASPGMVANDTITFTISGGATFTLTAKASETPASGFFKCFTAGTPAQNIENTARSLVSVANTYTSNSFLNFFYTSGFDQLPGQINITRQNFDNVPVAITASNGAAFTPIFPTSGTAQQTTAEVTPNRIFISKAQQPEAVPLYRYFDVGTASSPIERIIALRDGVLILKTDGVFRISGFTMADFRLSALDTTTQILCPNSAVALDNQVFFMSAQGVVAASDTGVQIVSRPIERTLLELSSALYPAFPSATHAVAYESDRKYIMWTVTLKADTVATQAFVYNILTNSWTTWDIQTTASFVNPVDNKLYYGIYLGAGNPWLYQERKDFASTDFADEQINVTITNVLGDQVTLGPGSVVFDEDPSDIVPGMTLSQGDVNEVITAVDMSNFPTSVTVTTVAPAVYVNGNADVFKPILCVVKTIPITGRNPLKMKKFSQLNLIFSDSLFDFLTVTFTSDLSLQSKSVELESNAHSGWGRFPWSLLPWGQSSKASSVRLRTYVPQELVRANFIQIEIQLEQAFTSFSLNGFGVDEQATATRMK